MGFEKPGDWAQKARGLGSKSQSIDARIRSATYKVQRALDTVSAKTEPSEKSYETRWLGWESAINTDVGTGDIATGLLTGRKLLHQ